MDTLYFVFHDFSSSFWVNVHEARRRKPGAFGWEIYRLLTAGGEYLGNVDGISFSINPGPL